MNISTMLAAILGARRAVPAAGGAGMAGGGAAAVAADAHAGGPDDEEALPAGCGWFDSSQDLRSGLAVIEHDAIDVTRSLRLWYGADPVAA